MNSTTTLSSKGQVVLPRLIRTQLRLAPGSRLRCEVHGDSVVLTPEQPQKFVRKHVIDPDTGLRVSKASKQMEKVSSEMIKALMEEEP